MPPAPPTRMIVVVFMEIQYYEYYGTQTDRRGGSSMNGGDSCLLLLLLLPTCCDKSATGGGGRSDTETQCIHERNGTHANSSAIGRNGRRHCSLASVPNRTGDGAKTASDMWTANKCLCWQITNEQLLLPMAGEPRNDVRTCMNSRTKMRHIHLDNLHTRMHWRQIDF